MTGVTMTVTKLENGVTVSVDRDSSGLADKMQALVDNANAALAEISAKTDYDPDAKKGQILTGDYTVRQLSNKILSAVSSGKQGYGDFSQLGVALSKDGKLTFDREKFVAAYQANPSTVESAVKAGLADSMKTVAKAATDFTTGSLTNAIQGATSMVSSLNKQISEWDTRLEQRQLGLVKKFANLEVALGKMRDQSNWLAGQLASLPSSGGR
jgi:flagellar hook-associated protein 2